MSYDEIKDLLDNKITQIIKEGKTISKDEIKIVDGFKILYSDKVKIGDVDAYKIGYSSYYNDTKEIYLLIYNNTIYQIELNLSSYYIDEIEDMIKNIKFN